MKRTHWTWTAVAAATLLAVACAAQAPKEDAEKKALEQRVAELEKKLEASPSPAAAPKTAAEPSAEASVAPAPAPAPRPVAPARRAPESRPAAEPPAPRPTPRPTPRPIRIPAGTALTLILETPLSSATSVAGDRVTARIEKAVSESGRVVLPGGSVIEGGVLEARSSGRVKGRARLAVGFDTLVVRGVRHRVSIPPITVEAPEQHGRDAKIVGGAAAAGAILGAIAGGKGGAAKGTILGGAAGAGAVLLTKGQEIEMPAGSQWTVHLERELVI